MNVIKVSCRIKYLPTLDSEVFEIYVTTDNGKTKYFRSLPPPFDAGEFANGLHRLAGEIAKEEEGR